MVFNQVAWPYWTGDGGGGTGAGGDEVGEGSPATRGLAGTGAAAMA